ncbi:phosphatidate phosphatase App1 family protein [Pleionea sediminis]|uniref:phosphatidate phosphatase App1 family protein n=1 Tax=Pleionea sediminis TaxID=2569479 RepID=UPI0011870869|nr:phosphatase domain-containing protein [Pleionea sediminis]
MGFIRNLLVALLIIVTYSSFGFSLDPEKSVIKDDETVIFFNTEGYYSEQNQTWALPIHGWIFEPADSTARTFFIKNVLEIKYNLKASEIHEENLTERLTFLMADNERGKSISINLCGKIFELSESKENGHFKQLIHLDRKYVNECENSSKIEYFAIAQDHRVLGGETRLLENSGFSIISDIDDTIKQTQVTERKELIKNTFFEDFDIIEGMNSVYRWFADEGVALHFVSSSPWQLYPALSNMTAEFGFPWATFSLKSIRFRDSSIMNLFKPGTETKPAQIANILSKYPKRKFILIGDSGEKDPEVYGEMMRKYPEQVVASAIRNIGGDSIDNSRLLSAFDGVSTDRYLLFEQPSQLKAWFSKIKKTTN